MSDLDPQTVEATARDIEMTYEMLYAFLTTHPNDAETFEAAWADARRQSSEAIAKHVAEVQRLRAAQAWQPIETADADTPVVLFTPRHRLTDLPVHIAPEVKAEIRVSAPRYWTWATHWQQLPAPPLLRATAGKGRPNDE